MTQLAGPVLVLGATGAQGGAVANALLAAGKPVRVLLRDSGSAAAAGLAAAGAEVVQGDMDDEASLAAALSGAAAVFSVQVLVGPKDPDYEVRTGRKVIEAAFAAGVRHFLQTSVARAGDHAGFAQWNKRHWGHGYWEDKAAVVAMARARGFERCTVLKPAFMMENFAMPRAAGMFPSLAKGELCSAYGPRTRIDLIAAADIGAFANAALDRPDAFNGAEIELAGEQLSTTEIASVLASVTGHPLPVRHLSAAEAVAAGMSPGLVENQEWSNVEGYRVDIDALATWGVPLTSFRDWAQKNRSRLRIGPVSGDQA